MLCDRLDCCRLRGRKVRPGMRPDDEHRHLGESDELPAIEPKGAGRPRVPNRDQRRLLTQRRVGEPCDGIAYLYLKPLWGIAPAAERIDEGRQHPQAEPGGQALGDDSRPLRLD